MRLNRLIKLFENLGVGRLIFEEIINWSFEHLRNWKFNIISIQINEQAIMKAFSKILAIHSISSCCLAYVHQPSEQQQIGTVVSADSKPSSKLYELPEYALTSKVSYRVHDKTRKINQSQLTRSDHDRHEYDRYKRARPKDNKTVLNHSKKSRVLKKREDPFKPEN